jgi:amidohydrolase
MENWGCFHSLSLYCWHPDTSFASKQYTEEATAVLDFKELALEQEKVIINWRRDLHRIPEVGHDLPETAKYIAARLEEMGVGVQRNVGGHGVVGLIRGRTAGKTIALRSDMDGLPLEEETNLPFTSEHKGCMHACGHDAHMAMTLGAARILQEKRNQLQGQIKLIFQPAEEGPGGAKPMIEAGVLKHPTVDAILGLHIGSIFPELGNGQVGVCYGPAMACLDSFKIVVKGKGGHGAMPNATVDPVTISAEIILGLQTLISRELKPSRPGVITIGKIQGGTAYNIIPEKVELHGTARFIHEEERQRLSCRLGELSRQIAQAMRGDCEVRYNYGYPPLENSPTFTKFFAGIASSLLGPENVIEISEPTMGGEDMAYFLQHVPGTFFFLGGGKVQEGRIYPHHHPKFDVDESVLWRGAALLAATATCWLKENS